MPSRINESSRFVRRLNPSVGMGHTWTHYSQATDPGPINYFFPQRLIPSAPLGRLIVRRCRYSYDNQCSIRDTRKYLENGII